MDFNSQAIYHTMVTNVDDLNSINKDFHNLKAEKCFGNLKKLENGSGYVIEHAAWLADESYIFPLFCNTCKSARPQYPQNVDCVRLGAGKMSWGEGLAETSTMKQR